MISKSFPFGCALAAAVLFYGVGSARAALDGYWPVTATSGTTIANTAGLSPNGLLSGGASFFTDPLRGQVLEFDGVSGLADLGGSTIPQLTTTNDFTWSFWSYDLEANAGSNNIILGNRYAADLSDPLQFTKFTTNQFEFYPGGAQSLDYVNQPSNAWVQNVVVKSGSLFTYFRNGALTGTRTITAGMSGTLPLYLGNDKKGGEAWKGRIDEVAVWSNALPVASVAKLAKGSAAATSVATTQAAMATAFSENFTLGINAGVWTATNRGLESNQPAGYNAPAASGGVLTLGGTTGSQYWYGSSLESVARYDSNTESLVSVDRTSLTGTGTAFRSSLWVLGDDAHYLHFAQNFGEGGWSFNARDDGGTGTTNPTGTGFNLAGLDSLDADGGQHKMSVRIAPTGTAGSVFMYVYLDDTLAGSQFFTNFPANYSVVLTGQARAIGDNVNAVFDNVVVQQAAVPEPATSMLLLSGLALAARRRRRA